MSCWRAVRCWSFFFVAVPSKLVAVPTATKVQPLTCRIAWSGPWRWRCRWGTVWGTGTGLWSFCCGAIPACSPQRSWGTEIWTQEFSCEGQTQECVKNNTPSPKKHTDGRSFVRELISWCALGCGLGGKLDEYIDGYGSLGHQKDGSIMLMFDSIYIWSVISRSMRTPMAPYTNSSLFWWHNERDHSFQM